MRLFSLRIRNLRVFEDQTIYFDDFNCLVGPNGSGKSTILFALNILFRETEDIPIDTIDLAPEDFFKKQTDKPIIITATFSELDSSAQSDFADYYRQGKLIITCVAEFDKNANKASVKQHGQRLGMRQFAPFFEAEKGNAKVSELKEIYNKLRIDFSELPPPGTKEQMINSLREYERNNPSNCDEILSSDEFYGFTRGINRLSKYLQWIYVPAIKDISSEREESKDSALGKLLARTVRARINFRTQVEELRTGLLKEYQDILAQNQDALTELSSNLSKKLQNWAHPDTSIKLEWTGDPEKSIRIDEPSATVIARESNFAGDLCRFGHGLQRSYLFALLHELSGCDDLNGPKMIFGCEEPELFQHPPQLRHLAAALFELSRQNSQIIVSTHSPYFIAGEYFENVKVLKKCRSAGSKIININKTKILATLNELEYDHVSEKCDHIPLHLLQVLRTSINEMFFTRVLVFIEGLEDLAYITTYLNLSNLWSDIRKYGCHFVPTDRKSYMVEPIVIAKYLEIPTFVVFDSDTHLIKESEKKEQVEAKHKKDNSIILKLMGCGESDPLPDDTIWADNLVMWKSSIDRVVDDELGDEFESIKNRVRAKYGNPGGIEKKSLFIAETLNAAWVRGIKSPSLLKLCDLVHKFAATN